MPEPTLRDWINLIMEGSASPPMYDPEDEDHYEVLGRTGFFGEQAAGCVFFARSTKRFLLMLRSRAVLQPGTWGNCGGAHKATESPLAAAQREGHEETGYSGPMEMIPLMIFQKDSFRYSNFLAIVDDEFEPDLGWEADNYCWVEFGKWPRPLHFGLEALFSDAASVAKIKSLLG